MDPRCNTRIPEITRGRMHARKKNRSNTWIGCKLCLAGLQCFMPVVYTFAKKETATQALSSNPYYNCVLFFTVLLSASHPAALNNVPAHELSQLSTTLPLFRLPVLLSARNPAPLSDLVIFRRSPRS